ncbi:DUF4405 domain-containing protein [Desulfovibrio sp. OttesenSCG-928-A18]|nr:DUF4405 domain-containing protein [Desulfovibrio sp. OttesenSCG-928-A18]
MAARFTIDGAMVLLLVSSLGFRATGREAHEWIGVLFCVLLALHTIWNWGWYKNLFAGTYSARRAVGTITNLALVAVMAALCVCGVLNSRHIFGFSRFIDGDGVRQIHSLAAYWGLILVGIHAGLHWDIIMVAARKAFGGNGTRKSAALPLRVLAIVIAGLGMWASYERDMASKLFLGFSFDFWNPDWPLVFFYACNLAIMGMYAFVAHYALKILQQLSRRQSLTTGKESVSSPLQQGEEHEHIF